MDTQNLALAEGLDIVSKLPDRERDHLYMVTSCYVECLGICH